jgi:nucleotide-binding universal stress UspA family protein
MFRHILVAVDGSAHSDRAVEAAGVIARCCESRVTLLHVLRRRGKATIPPSVQQFSELEHIEMSEQKILQSVAEKLTGQARKRLAVRGVTQVTELTEIGNPAERIAEIAKRFDVDLVVMGRRGLGAVGGMLMGSVTSSVNHLAQCACLTVV